MVTVLNNVNVKIAYAKRLEDVDVKLEKNVIMELIVRANEHELY